MAIWNHTTAPRVAAMAALLALGGACAEETVANDGGPAVIDPTHDKGEVTAQKADQWGHQDRPSIFTSDLEYRADELPWDGEVANAPWASSYWPVYQDSINRPWEGPGTLSPAAKYGKAFGVTDIEDKVSKYHGIAKYGSRTACTSTSDCDSAKGESCAKRDGEDSGVCIPTWWGICHAWAPASIMEPEPLHPVTRNGVVFKQNDIRALVTLVYDKPTSKFVSLRCNDNDDAGEIEYDEYGRPTGSDAECKDTNAGTYHLLITNFIGIKGQSFVEDRTFDDQVWNQPLNAYRITKMDEITAQKANELVGVQPEGDDAPTREAFSGSLDTGVWHHADPLVIAAGDKVDVTMTGTGDADLYVRFGSQPTENDYTCRPWDSGSAETCSLTAPAGATKVYVSVYGYSGPLTFEVESLVGGAGSGAIPTTYKFNSEAVSFRHVKLEVDYVSEASSTHAGTTGDNIQRWVHTDYYSYVLELDAAGKINGGEWIGSSKRNHPDFLWLPDGRYNTPIAGGAITYAKVKSLLDESINGSGNNGNGTEKVIEESGSVAQGEWKHFGPFNDVTSGFNAVMTGTGDADLYVRAGNQPTSGSYDCRPYTSGSDESCGGATAGAYYVSVYGYRASDFSLTIRYQTGGGTGPAPTVTHLDESGHVEEGEMKTFTVDVVGGQKIVVRTTAAADVDLYLRMNLAPTTLVYDQRAYTASGNETLTLTPTADGKLYVAVDGYEASDFTLKTADQ